MHNCSLHASHGPMRSCFAFEKPASMTRSPPNFSRASSMNIGTRWKVCTQSLFPTLNTANFGFSCNWYPFNRSRRLSIQATNCFALSGGLPSYDGVILMHGLSVGRLPVAASSSWVSRLKYLIRVQFNIQERNRHEFGKVRNISNIKHKSLQVLLLFIADPCSTISRCCSW